MLLVAESEEKLVGVALAVCQTSAELGRVMDVNDFYVIPSHRRKGVGTALAKKLLESAQGVRTDEINLEIIAGNRVTESFWKSLGFELVDRSLYRCRPK